GYLFGHCDDPPIDPRIPQTIVRKEYSDGGSYTLTQKAENLERLIQSDHISPEGLLEYSLFFEELKNNKQAGKLTYCIGADTCCWTGVLLAAESLRYATLKHEQNPQAENALSMVGMLVTGLGLLDDITQKNVDGKLKSSPGFYARNLAPASFNPNQEWNPGFGRFSRYHWKGDVSKDQYAGLMFGYSTAWQICDNPLIKKEIAKRVASIADHLIDNDNVVTDLDGNPTTFGNIQNKVFGIPIGVNSLIALNIFKNAAVMTNDKKYKSAYENLIDKGYADSLSFVHFEFIGRTNPNNDNMGFLSYYPILGLEHDPVIRKKIVVSLQETWEKINSQSNSFWNFIYNAKSDKIDEKSIQAGIESLRIYSLNRRSYPVDHRWRTDIEKSFFCGRKNIPQAAKPFPINQRSISPFIWKSQSYVLFSSLGENGEIQYAPTDYLIAYWLGRYYNFIGSND
ncbi:hypothetical protein HYX16_01415, partial [Candidatus Woesearchaeota archaeon]|nr:hypothetical protein [Candidatus Woesearchaeota archaeon]